MKPDYMKFQTLGNHLQVIRSTEYRQRLEFLNIEMFNTEYEIEVLFFVMIKLNGLLWGLTYI